MNGVLTAGMFASMLPLGKTKEDEQSKYNDKIAQSQNRQAKAQSNLGNDADSSGSWTSNYSNANADLLNVDKKANELEDNYQHDITDAYNKDQSNWRHHQLFSYGTDIANLVQNVFVPTHMNLTRDKYEEWANPEEAKVESNYQHKVNDLNNKRQQILDNVAASHTMHYDNFVKGLKK